MASQGSDVCVVQHKLFLWDDLRVVAPRFRALAVALLTAALGLATLAVARDAPDASFAGSSAAGEIAALAGGWSLVAAGLAFSLRRPGNRFGLLLVGAGFAWFLPEWANPGALGALAYTVGLVGGFACVPLVAHAALTYPTGRLRARLELVAVVLAYAGAALSLGLAPALVFDPKAAGCFDCPRNLVLVDGSAGRYTDLNRVGFDLALLWLSALGAVLLWRITRSLRRRAGIESAVAAAAGVYLALVAAEVVHARSPGLLTNDSLDRALWRYQAAALTALAVAVGWGLVREREARVAVARLVVELAASPKPGDVREALARSLGDPGLELAYRDSRGSFVDAAGRPTVVGPGEGRAVTTVLRGDVPIAALVHSTELLDRPGLVEDVLAAARVAIENERLQAEVRARLEELRASRARIVETGDAERRKLERDLHDGAQQRLLALSYDLRLARARANGDAATTALLTSAVEEARAALDELRRLAHGIYPAILEEAGLAPALSSLADDAPIAVELGAVPVERLADAVETAAYVAVADAVDDAAARGATFISVDVARDGERLLVSVDDDGSERPAALVHLADRIGALGGSLETGPTTLRAEIPCA
jgi:signal transduction histidine kinase